MAASDTTLVNAWKDTYGPKEYKQLNEAHPLWSQCKKLTKPCDGKREIGLINVGLTASVFNMRSQLNFTQEAGVSEWANPTFYPVLQLGTFRYDFFITKLTRTKEGAFLKAKDDIKNMLIAFYMDRNRQMFSDGSGYLAKTAGDSDTTTPCAVSKYLWGGTTKPAKYLKNNQRVSVIASDCDTLYSGAEDNTPNGLMLNGAQTTEMAWDAGTLSDNSAAHYIGKYGAIYDSSNLSLEFSGQPAMRECMGLYGIVSASDPITGSLGGVAVSATPDWASYSLPLGGAELTLPHIFQCMMNVKSASGKLPNALYTTYDLLITHYKDLLSYFGIDNSVTGKDPGAKDDSFKFAGVKLVPDNDCPDGTAFLINTDALQVWQAGEAEFLDHNSDQALRIANTIQSEMVYGWIGQFVTTQRNAHAVISGAV